MNSADVYICTSHDEGLGLPLLEAQYAGLAVVAPDQTVFREVLGASATFIDPADAALSAAAISNLVTTPGWRAAWANAATCNLARWNALAASDLADVRRIFAGSQVATVASSVDCLRQL
jgi:glycosyltransferase involved in cell wall biosynthesis